MEDRRPLLALLVIPLVLGCSADGALGAGSDAGVGLPPPGPDAGSLGHEICGDGFDDDGDGLADEGCPCTMGTTQSCHPSRFLGGVGVCSLGTQRCEGTSEFGTWGACEGFVGPGPEVCDNGVDEDCNGADPPCDALDAGGFVGDDGGAPPSDAGTLPSDAGAAPGPDAATVPAPIEVPLRIFGDCVTATCPSEAPYPVGCNVIFTPGDDRGCVASRPADSTVYFQAGDECDAGFVSGTLFCSTVPGAPLDSANCPINKPVQYHVADRSMCPATH